MNIGQTILRLLSPEDEAHRQQMRRTMACVEAHTEDLHRTVILDGRAICRAIKSHMSENLEETLPPR